MIHLKLNIQNVVNKEIDKINVLLLVTELSKTVEKWNKITFD